MFNSKPFTLDQCLKLETLNPLSDQEQEIFSGGILIEYSRSTTIQTSGETDQHLSIGNRDFYSTSNSNYDSTDNTSFSLSGNPNPSRRLRSFLSRLI